MCWTLLCHFIKLGLGAMFELDWSVGTGLESLPLGGVTPFLRVATLEHLGDVAKSLQPTARKSGLEQ